MHDNEYPELAAVARRRNARRSGDEGASAPAPGPALDVASQVGNRAFTRHVVALNGSVGVHRSAAARSQGAGPLDPEIEAAIHQAQGGGRPLDDHVRQDMEAHLGADLSAVRVHADGRGDALSRSVQADAFTTGTDVFFRSGQYAPGSSSGRKLLAHELTHVVQQASGAVPAESRVSHPDDVHEREASTVADVVAAGPTVQRQGAEEEELDEEQTPVARQATEEELEEDEAPA